MKLDAKPYTTAKGKSSQPVHNEADRPTFFSLMNGQLMLADHLCNCFVHLRYQKKIALLKSMQLSTLNW